ncbi:MAG TPA: dihydrofolate reductase family protein [Polyangiaceae bacterium]|nr:dihydrofolate reductase family protein [Polyangiaceae bacterium]
MNPSNTSDLLPGGRALELLFDAGKSAALSVPEVLSAAYAGALRLPRECVFANFVASLDGVVALPGDTESGQIISGRNQADRFVMGLLRAAADAVLLGAGTFRKSGRHLWLPERIYPAGQAAFKAMRAALGLSERPQFVLVSASGVIDVTEPAIDGAWIVTTPKGEARVRAELPASARLVVQDSEQISLVQLLSSLRAAGFARILTEGGPSLFSQLVKQGLLDQLFLTSSPALFGRFAGDARKSLAEGLDLGGAACELSSARRHGSHLFLSYALGAAANER